MDSYKVGWPPSPGGGVRSCTRPLSEDLKGTHMRLLVRAKRDRLLKAILPLALMGLLLSGTAARAAENWNPSAAVQPFTLSVTDGVAVSQPGQEGFLGGFCVSSFQAIATTFT